MDLIMAHGSCKKFGCGCQYYSKSLLTPGLCKTCNHLKDQHNQFMPMEDHDDLPDDANTSLTASMALTASTDYESDEDDHSPHGKRRSKKLKPRIDDYAQQILKKKEDLSHLTESMWKNKYFESQKEVEFWQTKYNNLYVEYKELLKQKGTADTKDQPQHHKQRGRKKKADLVESTTTESAEQPPQHEPIDLLSGNHNDGNDTFANWTTFQ